MSRIVFSEEGWADYLFWQSRDKKIVEKINQLIQNIEREGPMKGIGKPERLKYDFEYYNCGPEAGLTHRETLITLETSAGLPRLYIESRVRRVARGTGDTQEQNRKRGRLCSTL